MKQNVTISGQEKQLRDGDFIVSKTDLKGRITYCNRIFIELSGYAEGKLLGEQHNIVRHPEMPRGIFKLMWDTLSQKKEMFTYLKDKSSDGGFYWTFGHVAPSFDDRGNVIGYYSVRRKAKPAAISVLSDLYDEMLEQERRAGPNDATAASLKALDQFMQQRGVSYEEFILSL